LFLSTPFSFQLLQLQVAQGQTTGRNKNGKVMSEKVSSPRIVHSKHALDASSYPSWWFRRETKQPLYRKKHPRLGGFDVKSSHSTARTTPL
jgi:hypothetical protein